MKTLVLGASGATGNHAVKQLLALGGKVKVIIRSTSNLPNEWLENENVTVIKTSINEISINEMAIYIEDCHAVVSCLGHNINLKGIYGQPRKLVTNAVKLVCDAIKIKNGPVKIVLMNTAGNRNKDLIESIPLVEKMVIGLMRLCLPPHVDNENAAEYLRSNIGQNHPNIQWVVIRPDSLINTEAVSAYTIHFSPTTSALLNPGKTSRINVGNFIAKLLIDGDTWKEWVGKMPVIYNK